MVVKIAQKSDVGSNKTQNHAVAINCIGYWYKRPNKYKATITKPKIDKLAITLHIHDEYRKVIYQQLWDMVKDKDCPEYINSKAGYSGSSYYGTSVCWVDPVSKSKVLIQCKPTKKAKKNTPYLRLELNPDQLGPKGLSAFKDQFLMITLGNASWQTLIDEGCITRLDVAVDLINVDVEDLLVAAKKPGKKLSYFGIGGKIETAYQNTTNTVYVYDKKQKQLDAGLEPEYGNTPHTRVEIRTRTTKGISGLPKLMNHLKKVSIVDIEAPDPPESAHSWAQFQDACRYKGLDGALNTFPEELRSQYKAAIDAVEREIWKPKDLWGLWPETVAKSGLLEP